MATPAVDRRAVAADLRQDWLAALRQVGFDTDLPAAWVAEGLLHYLAPYAKHRLLDDVTALSTEDSGLALDNLPCCRRPNRTTYTMCRSSVSRARWMSQTGRPETCIAGCHRTHRSTSAARGTIPVSRCQENAHPR
jgi:methyltransferase (TIGR00027 family)